MRSPDFPTRVGQRDRHIERREREVPRIDRVSPVYRTFAVETSADVSEPPMPPFELELSGWTKTPLGVPNFVDVDDGIQAIPTASGLWLVTVRAYVSMSFGAEG